MKKWWTVKNGRIGTAHINRGGQLVDFREGTPQLDEHNKKIIMSPPKGVFIDPLQLETIKIVDRDEEQVTGIFKGVEVSFIKANKAKDLSKEETQRATEATEAALKVDVDTILRIGKATHRELGKMKSPYLHKRIFAFETVCRRYWDIQNIPWDIHLFERWICQYDMSVGTIK